MITTLRIRKAYKSMELVIKWFSIISILNDFKWSPLEIKIIAFAAYEGNISAGGKKDKFCKLFNSTTSSLDNSISKLSKKQVLVKYDERWMIHPAFKLDFNNTILAQFKLEHVVSPG
jgi:hypothetical protein